MRVTSPRDNEIMVIPETEIESAYMSSFLRRWNGGDASLSLCEGLHGIGRALEFRPNPPKLIPSPFVVQPNKKTKL